MSGKVVGRPGASHTPQNEMSWFMLPIQPNLVTSNFAWSLPIIGSTAVEAENRAMSTGSRAVRL